MVEHGADLTLGRNIDTDLQALFVALVEPVLTARLPTCSRTTLRATLPADIAFARTAPRLPTAFFAITRDRPSRIRSLRNACTMPGDSSARFTAPISGLIYPMPG
jgi:hypothetical protein